MCFPYRFCCICLYNKSDLKFIFDIDNDGLVHFDKLISTIAEMNIEEMNDERLICGECCVTLNTAYNFRQTCLRNKTKLKQYIAQLKTSNTNLEENSTPSSYQNERTDKNHEFVTIKEKYEIKEVLNITNKNAAVDNLNETSCISIKIEEPDYIPENYIEVPFINIKNDIDIEEDPLVEMKKEYLETPQDGSTSHADENETKFEGNIIESNINSEKSQDIVVKTKRRCGQKINECHVCHKIIKNKSNFNRHLRTHSDQRSFECEICKKIFIQKRTLMEHMRRHSEDKTYQCEICDRRFIYEGILKTHMLTHANKKPYECDLCKKRFSEKYNLTVHKRIHAGITPFKCETCGKGFVSKKVLKKHMLIHSSDGPYECEICEKKIYVKNNLATHMRIHSGERPYECEFCDKKFIVRSHLTKHMAIHTDVEPYECEVCKKKYTRKDNLVIHMRLHAGQGLHECELCLKKFTRKKLLNNHLRIHSGERPYECEICKKTFIQTGHLHKHMQVHASEIAKKTTSTNINKTMENVLIKIE